MQRIVKMACSLASLVRRQQGCCLLMAQAPVISLMPSQVPVSRVLFDTSWEGARDMTYGATWIMKKTRSTAGSQ